MRHTLLSLSYKNITSTDLNFVTPLVETTARTSAETVKEYQIFRLSDYLRPTTTGLDGLPSWFLRLAAPAYSNILSFLINQSIQQWKTSVISIQSPRSLIQRLQWTLDQSQLLRS